MVDDMAPDSEEDDDWTKYADTGYATSYDPWADLVPATEIEEEEFDEDFDEFDDVEPVSYTHLTLPTNREV